MHKEPATKLVNDNLDVDLRSKIPQNGAAVRKVWFDQTPGCGSVLFFVKENCSFAPGFRLYENSTAVIDGAVDFIISVFECDCVTAEQFISASVVELECEFAFFSEYRHRILESGCYH